jgi:hypothetical protein
MRRMRDPISRSGRIPGPTHSRPVPTVFGIPIGLFAFFGLLLLAVGGVFALVSGLFLFDEYRFRTDGVTTDAIVIAKGVNTSSSRPNGATSGPTLPGGGGTTRKFWASYRFTDADGRAVSGRDNDVDYDVWSRLREHAPARIAYLSRAPSHNRIAEHVIGWLIPFTAAVAAVVMGFGTWALAHELRRVRVPAATARRAR